MTAINFPDSPSNGDTHVVGGVTYTYNSTETKWKTTINSNAFLPLTGGTLSGTLTVNDDLVVDTDTLFVDASADRVGIGTTSPGQKLHVESSSSTYIQVQNTGNSVNAYYGVDTAAAWVGSSTNHPLALHTNNTERARIDSSGRLLVGTTDSSGKHLLKVNGTTAGSTDAGAISLTQGRTAPPNGSAHGVINFGSETRPDGGAQIVAFADGAWTDGSDHNSGLYFATTANGATSPTERMRIRSDGQIVCVATYDNTTANAANVHIFSDKSLGRSTSSIRFKTDVETLQDSYADEILKCRPVWYRSLCNEDNQDWGYWGFIAEEVEQVDPRLCQYGLDEDGNQQVESVQYDRFVPHLLNLIKRQKEQLESQAATIAALDARLTALEGGTN